MDNPHKIMPCRYESMQNAINGIDSSNTYLVGYSPTEGISAIASSDDMGLYLFTQFFHKHFHLDANQILYLFYFLVFTLGFILASVGVLKLFKHKSSKILGISSITLLLLISYYVKDVYIMYYLSTCLALLFLYLAQQAQSNKTRIIIGLFFGIAIAFINVFRIYSSMALLLFILSSILIHKNNSFKSKSFYILFLFIGMSLVNLFFNHIIDERNTFFKEKKIAHNESNSHHIWHAIYVGFGYIGNDKIAYFSDKTGENKIKKNYPKVIYNSKEYFELIEKEAILFIKQNPKFVLQTLIAKTSMIVLFFLIFGGIGIFYTIKYSFYTLEQVPFLLALGFNSIFGILVVPRVSYLLGFIGFSILYSIYFYNKKVELQH